jgi:uncharacterized protein YdeI (YjbR/CyaY-like superfamily)
MKRYESVSDYIEGNEKWKDELKVLRDIILETELVETVKWGVPMYTVGGKNVVGMASFKEHFALWFQQGVYMKDPSKVLINAQEGTTKGLRQWRFSSMEDIDQDVLKDYLKEAIENQKAGKVIKPKGKKVQMPSELEEALNKDADLKAKFEMLTPYKQKEYSEHIGSAKQEKTRIARLEKALSILKEGKGLHDKYR